MKLYGIVLTLAVGMMLGGAGAGDAAVSAAAATDADGTVPLPVTVRGPGINYYVSTTGSDSNSGTSTATPWKTLQHAADSVSAGDTVHVMGGIYKQKLKIRHSGSAEAGPITFQSYNSQTVVLDGAGLSVTDDEGMIEITDASYIVVQDFEIRNYKTATRDKVPSGILVRGAGSDIVIRNNYIHGIRNTAAVRADLSGRNAHGIAVYGTRAPDALSRISIIGNTLRDLILGSSESMVVNGNVDGFTIKGNTVHDNDNIGIDVIGFEGTAPDPAYDQARNGLISGNLVYNITSVNNPAYGDSLPNDSYGADGIYVDGGKDTIIERNFSYNNDIGIEIASEHRGKATSNIIVRSNIVAGNNYTGIAMGGYDKKRGSTEGCAVIGNTVYMNDTKGLRGGQLLLQYDTKNNVIKNNIFVAGVSKLLIANPYQKNSGNQVNYNLYFAPGSAGGAKWQWKNVSYSGFAAYKAGAGQDNNAIFADPLLANPAVGNYRLTLRSPAINAGTNLGYKMGELDFKGNNRVAGSAVDIGADEY
ncbi:choice-of-anchor Q domain-containing protein [Paenibacillus sp. GCM10027626]|uniref:choice-of-anchor Q domain-containing protein n=1 Tax=Paenibacillus sp. GCM10027626 TaxID=3273411 RepID=UPI00362B1539